MRIVEVSCPHVHAAGNMAEGTVFYTVTELLAEGSTILVLGGSTFLLLDLVVAGHTIVSLYGSDNFLEYERGELKKFLSRSPGTLEKRFFPVIRGMEESLSDLLVQVQGIVCIDILHHLKDPRALLARLIGASLPLVVLDSTVELETEIIAEALMEGHENARAEHSCCRKGAETVGLSVREDVETLLREAHTQPPNFFQYGLTCCWCGKPHCNSWGHFSWIAMWRDAPQEVSA